MWKKTTTLYSASDSTGFSDSYAVPAGNSDVMLTGSVDLILPNGITQQVSDTLSTALKCTHFMEQQKLYSLPPNEDATIIHLRPKLLDLENNYINQKIMNSSVFTYVPWEPSSNNSCLWLTWLLFQRHLRVFVLGVLGFHGSLIQALVWRLTGLI